MAASADFVGAPPGLLMYRSAQPDRPNRATEVSASKTLDPGAQLIFTSAALIISMPSDLCSASVPLWVCSSILPSIEIFGDAMLMENGSMTIVLSPTVMVIFMPALIRISLVTSRVSLLPILVSRSWPISRFSSFSTSESRSFCACRRTSSSFRVSSMTNSL